MKAEVTLPKKFVMLPADVLMIDHSQLGSLPKLVYSIIYTMLNNTNKFFMSNKEIGKRCGNYSTRSITTAIKDLSDLGLIITHKVIDDRTGAVKGREVYTTPTKISSTPPSKKLLTPHEESFDTPTKKSSNKYISVTRLDEDIRHTSTLSSSDEPDGVPAKDDHSEQVRAIIDYLNHKASKKFRPTTTTTKKVIHARMKDGFTVDDFKKVINNKWADWASTTINGVPAINYMRPETLFGTKFESYLNETPKQNGGYEDGATW